MLGRDKYIKKLISVIIPVYNAKKRYIFECINSVCGQTYTKWEAVIVDDGGDGETSTWLDGLTKLDDRIKIIHQKNMGVSVARNHGVELAKGEWIYFCDSDDLMKKEELEYLLYAAEETGADIVISGYNEIVESDTISTYVEGKGQTYIIDGKVQKQRLIYELIAPGYSSSDILDFRQFALRFPWAHLYRKEVISGILFSDELHLGEDKIFNLYAIDNCKKITLIEAKLHYYRVGVGVTSQYREHTLKDTMQTKKMVEEFLVLKGYEMNDDLMAKLELDTVSYLICSYFYHKNNPANRKQRKRQLIDYLVQNTKYLLKSVPIKLMTKKQKLLYLIFRLKCYWVLELLRIK